MKRMMLLSAALSLVAGSAAAQSLPDLMKQMIAAWNKPTEPFRVIDNIYYVGTNGLASYLIATPQGHILIDTVMPESTAQIESSIGKLGFKVADIKYIINTHAHIDHTGGLAQIKQETGAQMVAGAKDVPLLEGGFYPGREEEKHLNFPPVKVDRAVREGDTVVLGGVTLTAHETPGHSPGCTSWTTDVKDGEAMRSVIFFCSATVALNRLVGRPTYPGIVDDYKKTYAWAKTVHPDIMLAPHPEMYGMADKRAKIAAGEPSPFVRPGEFNAYLDRLETQFNEGLAKQTAALQSGK
ncbi:subclass B3 metallo-beta-lactamase [Bradyrhizobium aeschynomenes]|uniref:subclass B3 metallo-beta-lactamase n=1 Tax=Bradyrhizobium aeschynomenes TaxID=2734909 RepID=UPI00155385CE|nr:subclass B3 metallo-beta-lactamase [Bradyrhizobium aeschynomenes]NPV23429.1 subclass B3 metallo-beta-lactamase [Bradyrhizobium aeschynomenes]